MPRSIGNSKSTDRSGHRLYTCTLLGYMSLWIRLYYWFCFRIFVLDIILIVMEGNKAKKKRKKKAAEGDGEKEHKRNWREVAYKPEEIEMNRNRMAYDTQLASEGNASDRGERVGSDTIF